MHYAVNNVLKGYVKKKLDNENQNQVMKIIYLKLHLAAGVCTFLAMHITGCDGIWLYLKYDFYFYRKKWK